MHGYNRRTRGSHLRQEDASSEMKPPRRRTGVRRPTVTSLPLNRWETGTRPGDTDLNLNLKKKREHRRLTRSLSLSSSPSPLIFASPLPPRRASAWLQYKYPPRSKHVPIIRAHPSSSSSSRRSSSSASSSGTLRTLPFTPRTPRPLPKKQFQEKIMAIDFSISELVALSVESFFFGTLPPRRVLRI